MGVEEKKARVRLNATIASSRSVDVAKVCESRTGASEVVAEEIETVPIVN